MDLPDFDRPPVDEVVVGIFHEAVQGYTDNVPVRFLSALADLGYTEFELQERLRNPDGDPTHVPSIRRTPRLQIVENREAPRVWLVTSDGRRVVQLQNDLLFLNWRRRGDEAYPRFERLLEEFDTVRSRYELMLAESGKLIPPVSVVEVTYINWIDDLPIEKCFRPAALGAPVADGVDTSPETIVWKSTHGLSSGDVRVGRLVIESGTAARLRDDGEVQTGIQLSLTARLVVAQGDGLHDALHMGRRAIVSAFANITTPEAHTRWQRTQ